MASKLTDAKVSTIKKGTEQDKLDERNPASGEDEQAPRLPHERDESIDSQQDRPRKDIKQAFDDIDEGQMDTDRRGMPGVEEVERKKPGNVQEDIPASSRMPSSIPKK
ncbi:hypothetical protein [Herminiimonas aquatilis]|uniref:Uncharacterized protein n=1 Tax=Herminiimonas aquatilis TaxID=345342 RepID=A0ABW2J588_9BURK